METRHRRRRSRRTLGSRLDEIPGIGPRRRRRLLRRFGSLHGISEAPLEELQAEVGVELGVRVFERMREWAAASTEADPVD